MRKLRIIVCLMFVASCVIFGIYTVKIRMVEDHTPPVITCEEDTISVSVEAEESELLQGVTAKDNRDGDITKSIRISSKSHFMEKGKCTVEYIVFDKANQAGTAQRTLIYTDYTSPKIHLTKPLKYTVSELKSADLTADMTAEDCLDGDLTNQIRTSLGDSFYDYEPGTYEITAQVSNSYGDVCAVPLEVTVTDNTDRTESSKSYPMLSEYIAYTKVGSEIDLGSYLKGIMRGGAEYTFAEDGAYIEVSPDQIQIQSNVDYSKAGTYTVNYSYTPEGGVEAVTKLAVVVEE